MNQPNTAPELLPCPFCGGFAEQGYSPDNHWAVVSCQQCRTSGKVFLTDDNGVSKAINHWNTRATPPAPDYAEVLEALEWYARDYDHATKTSQWDGGERARKALPAIKGSVV
jgi:Lar family restriction alleviation protein